MDNPATLKNRQSRRPARLLRAAFFAVLLGTLARPAEAWGSRRLEDWSQGLIKPNQERIVSVTRTVAEPLDGILCSDLRDWLEKNDFSLFACDMRRVVTSAGEAGAAPIFIFSGMVLPLTRSFEPGEFIGERVRLGPGRWRLAVLRIDSSHYGGSAEIVLSGDRVSRRH